jgi:hypothetical protein
MSGIYVGLSTRHEIHMSSGIDEFCPIMESGLKILLPFYMRNQI